MALFDIFKGKSQGESSTSINKIDNERVESAPSTEERPVVTAKKSEEISTETNQKVEFAKEKLETILRLSELGGTITVAYFDNQKVELNISDTDELGRIIGKDGVAINALQTLVRQFIYQKFKSGIRVQIDAADYKRKREDALKKESELAADKIRMGIEERVELDEMNASERRYVHGLFEGDDKVKSYSIGEGRRRHIVLEKNG